MVYSVLPRKGGVNMEKPTIEITLPKSKAKVVLYQYLSHGQFSELQRSLLSNVSVDVSKLTNDENKNKEVINDAMKSIPATVSFDEYELLQRFLIKEILLEDGTVIPGEKSNKFVYDLPIADGQFLQGKLEKIQEESSLSVEDKKK